MTARNVGKDVDKLDHSYLANGTVTLGNSNKRSRELSDTHQIYLSTHPRELKSMSTQNLYTKCHNVTWDSRKN